MWILLSLACSADPAALPAEDAVYPVGVRTEAWGGRALEVWYPATATDGEPEVVDFAAYVPESVVAVLGPVTFPPIPTVAARDAPLAAGDGPYPVIAFSHGLGGSRLQSPTFATTLAARGYVVVATDHPGRTLADLTPCLFSPALEGCDLGAALAESGAPDLTLLADWAEDAAVTGWLAGAIDPGKLGAAGHSLGGFSVTTAGDADDRFRALLPMAGANAVIRDVPTLVVGGTCDGVAPIDLLATAGAGSADAQVLTLAGAGHLAYSDMCTVRFDTFYADHLAGRDDLSELTVGMFLALADDGCPTRAPAPGLCAEDAYLELERSAEILAHYAVGFFDAHLRDGGPLTAGVFAEATLSAGGG